MVNPRQKMEHTNEEDEVLKHFKECLGILAKKIVMIIIQELQNVSKDVKFALVNNDSPLKSKKLTYSVVEAADILGLSRSATYEAIRTKQIPSIRFGRRIIIPRFALEKMLREAIFYIFPESRTPPETMLGFLLIYK